MQLQLLPSLCLIPWTHLFSCSSPDTSDSSSALPLVHLQWAGAPVMWSHRCGTTPCFPATVLLKNYSNPVKDSYFIYVDFSFCKQMVGISLPLVLVCFLYGPVKTCFRRYAAALVCFCGPSERLTSSLRLRLQSHMMHEADCVLLYLC